MERYSVSSHQQTGGRVIVDIWDAEAEKYLSLSYPDTVNLELGAKLSELPQGGQDATIAEPPQPDPLEGLSPIPLEEGITPSPEAIAQAIEPPIVEPPIDAEPKTSPKKQSSVQTGKGSQESKESRSA